jgi:uncharacterized repeat protein (TIGR01451 family)
VLLAIGGLAAGGFATSAHAALTAGDLTMLYSGTAPFDDDDLAGNDFGDANTVIRSNDRVGYRFFYQTTGGDTNAQAVFTAPAGARWSYMPAGCGAGSAIVGQVLTCVLGNIPNAQVQSIDLEMNAGARTQGSSVPPATVNFTSNETPTPPAYTAPPTLTGSAAPRWDVVKLEAGYGQVFRVDSGPGGVPGFILPYNIMVQAENYKSRGGADSLKGLAPLGATVVINDTLPTPNARIMDYANPYQTTACVGQGTGFNQFNNSVLDLGPTSSTSAQAVANGGSCAATQVGQTAALTLTGVDSSLTHRPSTWSGDVIPPSDIRTTAIISKNLFVWIPQADVAPGGELTSITNTIPATTFTAQDGQQTYTEPNTSNNSFTSGLRNGGAGTLFKLSVPWGLDVNQPVGPNDAPGGVPTGYADAVNTTVVGSRWRPRFSIANTTSVSMTNLLLCDYFDNARQDLIETSPGVYATANATYAPPSTGAPRPPIPPANYVLEYGTGGALDPSGQWASVGNSSAQTQARCNDTGVTWATDPSTLPGGVGGVTRIRVRYVGEGGLPPGAAIGVRYGVQLRSTWRYTTAVNTPSAFAGTYAANSSIVPDDSFYSPANYRVLNKIAAMATGWTEAPAGYTVSVGVRRPSVFNSIRKTSISPIHTSPDPVGIGQTLKYQLAIYSRNVGYAGPETLTVTDVLPPGLSYVAGSSTYAGNPQQNGTVLGNGYRGGLPGTLAGEPSVSAGAPGCPTCTTLAWTINATQPAFSFENADPNSLLGHLQFDAVVGVVASGTQLLNSSTLDSEHDYAGDCTYQGPATGFVNPGCQKASHKLLVVSAPPGFYLAKTTPEPTRPINSTMDFNLALTGIGGDVTNARWIDILPYNGDAGIRGATGSSFPGTAVLAAINVPAGVTATYTKLAPGNLNPDPAHASNVNPGSIWCASLSGGACPASLAEVTGLRFEAAILTSGTVYNVGIVMEASGNGSGGRYINNFRATGTFSGRSPVLSSQDVRVDVASVSYVVTGTAGPGGAIGPDSQNVIDGATATLGITPDTGYVVGEITTTCSGGNFSGGNYTTLPVHADCHVHVTFKKKEQIAGPVAVPTMNEYALLLLSVLMVAVMGAGSLRHRGIGRHKR